MFVEHAGQLRLLAVVESVVYVLVNQQHAIEEAKAVAHFLRPLHEFDEAVAVQNHIIIIRAGIHGELTESLANALIGSLLVVTQGLGFVA